MFKRIKRVMGRILLDAYKRRKEKCSDVSLEHSLCVARKMLNKAKYCHLITQNKNGWCSARLVEALVDEEHFVFWVGTNPELRKVKEIVQNKKVNLAFENESENASLIAYCKAKIITDESLKKRYWKGQWRLFFPGGPKSEDYVVIRIEALRIELMNFSQNVVQAPFGLKPAVLIKQNEQWVMG